MYLAGDYPFTVRIWNAFDPELELNFKVSRYQRRTYVKSAPKWESPKNHSKSMQVVIEGVPEYNTNPMEYTIKGGESLAFSMYFADEYLVLSADYSLNHDYKISIGTKAVCFPSNSLGRSDGVGLLEEILDPLVGLPPGTEPDFSKKGYPGGTWTITPQKSDWALIIKKYGPDPEEDDVVVGPDEPT